MGNWCSFCEVLLAALLLVSYLTRIPLGAKTERKQLLLETRHALLLHRVAQRTKKCASVSLFSLQSKSLITPVPVDMNKATVEAHYSTNQAVELSKYNI